MHVAARPLSRVPLRCAQTSLMLVALAIRTDFVFRRVGKTAKSDYELCHVCL
jgi:hypothetical protein